MCDRTLACRTVCARYEALPCTCWRFADGHSSAAVFVSSDAGVMLALHGSCMRQQSLANLSAERVQLSACLRLESACCMSRPLHLSCGQYTGMQASKGSQLWQAPRLDTTWFIRSAIYMQHANMYRAKPMQLRR
jgi:hypothetical protein